MSVRPNNRPLELTNSKDATSPIGDPICVAVKVPVAGQQGKKPLPGQKPPGAKKGAAGTKELSSDDVDSSSDDEIALDMTPVEFSGHSSPVTSDDYLASSGASLDDGSTPGSVSVAFDDPELIAMQGGPVGDIANSNSGSEIFGSNPSGDVTASTANDGSTGNLASNGGSSADEPSYQFFLGDGSGGNPTGSTSGVVASNAGTSDDSPLYDAFLDDASTAGAGVFSSSPEGDVSLSSSSPMGDVSLFNTDNVDPGTGPSVGDQVASLTSFPDLSQGDISSSTDLLAGTSSNSEPNLFMEGSDMSLTGLPVESVTNSVDSGSDPGLFADSLSTGTDMFSDVARKVRRQELQNPYPGPEGWTMTRLLRREKQMKEIS